MKKVKELNNLLASMEAFTESNAGEFGVAQSEDLQKAREEYQEAELALESYQQAFKIITSLDEQSALSLEAYSSVMSLAESNVKLPDVISISLEDESKPSMFKQIKEKIKAAWSNMVDKLKNLFTKASSFSKSSLEKLKEKVSQAKDKVSKEETVSEEAFGDMFKKKLTGEDLYLIADKNNNLYKVEDMFKSLHHINDNVCKVFIKFIQGAIATYEKNFSIDTKNETFGFGGIDISEFEKLKTAMESIGSETKIIKASALQITLRKVNNLNAVGVFNYTKEKKTIEYARIQSDLKVLKQDGFALPSGEISKEGLDTLYTKESMNKLMKEVEALVKMQEEMFKVNGELLRRMSGAVMKYLGDPDNKLSDKEWVDGANRVIGQIKQYIQSAYNIVPDFLDLQGRVSKQLAMLY